jgi:hypothetical protein
LILIVIVIVIVIAAPGRRHACDPSKRADHEHDYDHALELCGVMIAKKSGHERERVRTSSHSLTLVAGRFTGQDHETG